ncbi:MAG: CAP domain-containing protein [Actinomycetota bacterium]|nr:CAP domain-containing protein [Actinomycetota bacterium]
MALIALSVSLVTLPASSEDHRALALPDGVQLTSPPAPESFAAADADATAALAVRWIDRVNSFRATAGLSPVTEVPAWTEDARLHSNYLVLNDRAGHGESASLPGYTQRGATAGANGNVISSTAPLTEAQAVDAWMTAPFHALGILDPRLTATGFGIASDGSGVRGAATLDVIRGLDWSIPWPSHAITWPGPGSTVPIGAYGGNEWPDPLGGCGAGWAAPTALPVIVMFPRPVASATATVNGASASSEVCVVTQTNFRANTSSTQTLGRGVLDSRNAVLVIARHPFANHARSTVDVVATATDGSTMTAASWFVVSDGPFGGAPVWAELQPGASGHWVVTDTGRVDASGTAIHLGGMDHTRLAQPIVAIQTTRSGLGYWLVAADGGIFSFGDAGFHGSSGAEVLLGSTVAMEATRSGQGYWIVTSAGQVRAFGDARHHGDMSAHTLAAPVVDITRTPSGNGYWMVASDGGVFTFGDALFHGSAGAIELAQPVVALEPTGSGDGYWLVALDGGVFAYGDAGFHGSAGGIVLDSAVRAVTRSPSSQGYWLLTERGQVLAFGDAVTGLQ